MREGPKTLLAALLTLLLAVGMAACGGDESSSTQTAAGRQAPAESKSDGDQGKPSKDGAGVGSREGGQAGDASSDSSSRFVPKEHDDSGGGSEQFRVKGGDNSVQEFGDEAEASERDAAATALHNYLDARAAGAWAAACEYLSKATIGSFQTFAAQTKAKDKSCGAILESLAAPAAMQSIKSEAEQADVGSLRIDDERAFLIYTGVDDTVLVMPMTNEGGSWKVASFSGTALY